MEELAPADTGAMPNRALRIGLSIVVGLVLAYLLVQAVLLLATAYMATSDCAFRGRGTAGCKLAMAPLFVAHIGVLPVVYPLLAWLSAWLTLRLLSKPRPGRARPIGVALVGAYFGWSAIFSAFGLMTLATLMRGPARSDAHWGSSAVVFVLSGLCSSLCAILLWRMRPEGRRVSIAYLLVSVALMAWGFLGNRAAPTPYLATQAISLVAAIAALGYLVSPGARAALVLRCP